MKTILSLAQTKIVFSNPEANLEQAEQAIITAAAQGSTLILFPELWSSGYDLQRSAELAEINKVQVIPAITQLAKQYQIAVGGSLITCHDHRTYNSFILIHPDSTIDIYDKTHLFGLMQEHQWFAPGGYFKSTCFPWGNAGLSICYDLRFPEMYRRYTLQGVKALLIVAEWPSRRIDHWNTLLRARAIENQLFVFAVNAAGVTDGVQYGGHSCVITPWGETLTDADDEPLLVTTEVDFSQVETIRHKLPALQDRRIDLY